MLIKRLFNLTSDKFCRCGKIYNMSTNLPTQPPKGTADWLPEEMAVRQYIFSVWRKVATRYGYREYLTPIVESSEIYRAKSGADVGGKELLTFIDQGGRELSIRPEMTPSVTRLVCQLYDSAPKPIRLFSIANFMRNEKPQRGRNREFWQLNVDIFGATSELSDLEILTMALDIMAEFKAPAKSFYLDINHRGLIDAALFAAGVSDDQKTAVTRLMDKWLKFKAGEFASALSDLGLTAQASDKLIAFLSAVDLDDLLKIMPELKENAGYQQCSSIINRLADLGYKETVRFKPSVIRGFDYYDGLVFEIFDNNPKNSRAIFGGGRYNGLAELFGHDNIPAAGFAPGDETTKLFLESWGLLDKIKTDLSPEIFYLPILSENLIGETLQLAAKLRADGKAVETGVEVVRLGKALDFANRSQIANMVIFGQPEKELGIYKIKDMDSGEEKEFKI